MLRSRSSTVGVGTAHPKLPRNPRGNAGLAEADLPRGSSIRDQARMKDCLGKRESFEIRALQPIRIRAPRVNSSRFRFGVRFPTSTVCFGCGQRPRHAVRRRASRGSLGGALSSRWRPFGRLLPALSDGFWAHRPRSRHDRSRRCRKATENVAFFRHVAISVLGFQCRTEPTWKNSKRETSRLTRAKEIPRIETNRWRVVRMFPGAVPSGGGPRETSGIGDDRRDGDGLPGRRHAPPCSTPLVLNAISWLWAFWAWLSSWG